MIDEFRAELRNWLSANRQKAPTIGRELDTETVEAWREWSRLLYTAGYAGITWPNAFGGQSLSSAYQAVWLEESAHAQVPDHLGVIGLDMAGPTIIDWGSDAQKATLLPPILACEEIWCQGFSEPESGSDLASVSTRAVLDGDGTWIVNGQKVWSSFASFADRCILLVRTEPEQPKHVGLSFLLVDMHAPGIEVRPLPQITGDPEFGEIFFTDVRVPAASMLGRRGDGWKVAMTTLAHERGTHGIALAARLEVEMRKALATVTETRDGRVAFGDPIVRDRFTRLWIELRGLQLVNRQALNTLERTGTPGPESTISKLRWSELNQELTELVGDYLGAEALELENDWSFARLRARGNTIEAGTSEILRNIIAERVLGLPRSR